MRCAPPSPDLPPPGFAAAPHAKELPGGTLTVDWAVPLEEAVPGEGSCKYESLLVIPAACCCCCCCHSHTERPDSTGPLVSAPRISSSIGAAQLIIAPWLVAPEPQCSQAPPFRCTPRLSAASWPSNAPSATLIRQPRVDSKRIPPQLTGRSRGRPSCNGIINTCHGTGKAMLAVVPATRIQRLPFLGGLLDSARRTEGGDGIQDEHSSTLT